MDDRELEGRLTARLHQRFDGAEPSYGLTARIAADRAGSAAVPASRWSWASLAPFRAGVAVAASLVLLVAAGLVLGPRLGIGPWAAAPSSLPSTGIQTPGPSTLGPSPSLAAPVSYRLTPLAFRPPKAAGSAASDVVRARLRALGYENFSLAVGDDLTVTLPGPLDRRVLDVLGWDGGATAYVISEGEAQTAGLGQAVPAFHAPVFTDADVIGLEGSETPSGPVLHVHLGPDAAARLGDATGANLGGALLIVNGDGRIELSATVASRVEDGNVELTQGLDSNGASLDVLRAVLGTEPMPAEWRTGAVTVESEIQTIVVTAASSGDATYQFGGHYVRLSEIAMSQSEQQCHVDVGIRPVDGGLLFPIVSYSLAPGSAVSSGPEPIDIPAGTYRVVVSGDCQDWSIRLQR
jgi:hypothetical protein